MDRVAEQTTACTEAEPATMRKMQSKRSKPRLLQTTGISVCCESCGELMRRRLRVHRQRRFRHRQSFCFAYLRELIHYPSFSFLFFFILVSSISHSESTALSLGHHDCPPAESAERAVQWQAPPNNSPSVFLSTFFTPAISNCYFAARRSVYFQPRVRKCSLSGP